MFNIRQIPIQHEVQIVVIITPLNYVQARESHCFISSDNNFFVIKTNIVSRNIGFYIFKKSVNVCDKRIGLCDDGLQVVSTYKNNYLLSREIFSSHIGFRFFFLYLFVVCDIVNFDDLVRWQFWKSIFDLDNVLNVSFRCLNI